MSPFVCISCRRQITPGNLEGHELECSGTCQASGVDHEHMLDLGSQIARALAVYTDDETPMVYATDTRVSLHMSQAQSQLLLAKLASAS